ncbi:MAG TPA: UDP-N-acetylmuramoyl-L-alanyl-D-glutamate--2,6-diaminopimelate ligase, partial [Ktedonobacterales bacterium]
AGAALVVGERPVPADFPGDRAYAQVENARRELGMLASAFLGHPSRRMEVIGITGTDGKTTTTYLVDWLLTHAGLSVGRTTTVDYRFPGEEPVANNSRFTTLEAPEVQRTLAEMAAHGAQIAIVETTSSGLALHRVHGIAYDIAVFTNLTSEHLEVHGTWESYRRAKAMLFEAVDPAAPPKPVKVAARRLCVLNADDPSCAYMRGFARVDVLTYGVTVPADVSAGAVTLREDGSAYTVRFPDGVSVRIESPLVGDYNVANCLAALSVGYAHGIEPDVMAQAMATFPGVPGRMERIVAGQPFTVVVDYAHTAESLGKILRVLRPITTGRLIVVFGSAGDRDATKRAPMGAVAAREADFGIITDEDPRTEDAMDILRQIATGMEAAGAHEGERYRCIVGRRLGIEAAMRMARPGDTVLLAGKGHEQSIEIGRVKTPWDDRRVAREVLAELGLSVEV